MGQSGAVGGNGGNSTRIVAVTVVVLLSVVVPGVAVGGTATDSATADVEATEAETTDAEVSSTKIGVCGAQPAADGRANAAAFAQNGSNFTTGSSSITTVELPGSVLIIYTRRPPQNQAGRIYRRVISVSKESFTCPDKGTVGICREVFRRRETVRTGRNRIVTNYYAVQCGCRYEPRNQTNDSSSLGSGPPLTD